jgi:aryl-alcohol dehydrogenase-like predicted oxidoreductase
LLTGKITKDYKFNEGDHRPGTPHFQPHNLELVNAFLDKIKPIADSQNASLTQLVVRWTLEQPGISAALVGARNPEQVEHNVKSLDVKLSSEEIKMINEELDTLNSKLEL